VKLHTVVVSYERLGLLKATISSYLDTVTVPHELIVVDNGSSPDVTRWLHRQTFPQLLLAENYYPGYATNRGFLLADPDANVLHRSDSDMEYLPGWCDAIQERLDDRPFAAIVGLRTDEEELHTTLNTGGTAVIRRHVWDEGLRYHEGPWVDDMTEDWRLCQDAMRMGYQWTRVTRPCVIHLGAEHARADDPYYQRSFGVRGITHLLE
jgi:glycosyltransferase involved in cell wall biosynthesis